MKEFFSYLKSPDGQIIAISCFLIGFGVGLKIGVAIIGAIAFFNVMARYR